MAGCQGLLQERLDLRTTRRDEPLREDFPRDEALEGGPPLPVRRGDQRAALQIEEVEQVQLQGDLPPERLDLVDPPEAAHQLLERAGPSLRVHRDDLAFQEERFRGHGPRELDDLGHALCDVRQPPAEHPHLVPPPVDLDAGAVELELEGRRPAVLLEDLVEVVPEFRHHRFDRGQEPEALGREPRRPVGEGDLRDAPQVPEEHMGRPHGLRAHARRVRDRLEHHALVDADPHLAEDALQEDLLLLAGGLAQEALEEPEAGPDGLGPARGRDPLERALDVEDHERSRVEAGLAGRPEGLLEGGPADVQRLLVRLRKDAPDRDQDGGGDLVPRDAAEELGDQPPFLEPLRRGLEAAGEVRELCERSSRLGRHGPIPSGRALLNPSGMGTGRARKRRTPSPRRQRPGGP